jgi:hypothetical protein
VIFRRFCDWLGEAGAIYEKLKLIYYSPGYRGVHSRRKIKVSLYSLNIELERGDIFIHPKGKYNHA